MVEVDHFRVDVEGISIHPQDRFHPRSPSGKDIEAAREAACRHADEQALTYPRVEVSAVSSKGEYELAYVAEGRLRQLGPLFPEGLPTRDRPSSLAERLGRATSGSS